MIHDVDETLTRLLTAELAATPGCPARDRDQITFDAPTVAEAHQDGEARVNLYLFDVRENLQERDEGLLRRPGRTTDDTVGTARPPARMDLSYLVSAHAGDDPKTEHRLLSDVLVTLLRRKMVAPAHLSGVLEGEKVYVSVAQPEHVKESDPKALWQALSGKLRPTLLLVVNAPLNPFETVWTKRVREAVMGVGPAEGRAGLYGGPEALGTRLSVAGVVLNQETERPLAGVEILIDGEETTASTSEEGLFLLTDLLPGQHSLHFQKRGYRIQEMSVTAAAPGKTPPGPLVVALRPWTDAEFASDAAERAKAAREGGAVVEAGRSQRVTISGRLRLPDGTPAAYVPVRIGERRAVTDAEGVYCFLDLSPGDHVVYAHLPGQEEAPVS